jgi:hypothetical protein
MPTRSPRLLLLGLLLLALAAPVSAQDTYRSRLDASDPILSDRSAPYEAYEFETETAQQVTVRMESADFDTYLVVESASGVEYENDDFSGTSVSQVRFLATEATTWTAYATAYGSSAEGDYELTITLGGSGEIVETVSGRLDPQDDQLPKGEYVDTHTFEGEAGTRYLIELTSLGFDGFLAVETPAGDMLRNDDAGSTRLSRVGPTAAPKAGPWTVYVTTLGEDEVGAYDLRIIAMPPEDDTGTRE